jgi:DNA-binding PadR family transcriptional regulator
MARSGAGQPTPLQCALLGLLSRRALSGYEILKRFRRSVVFFWHARRSQIYAELRRMETLGLVTSELAVQQARPNKRHYALTPGGRAALRAWLEAPAPAGPVKDPMLLRTFFADLLDTGVAARALREHGAAHSRVLAEFEAIRAALERRHGPLETTEDRALFFGHLVLQQGIRHERMYANWCLWAAEAVERRAPETAPTGRGGAPDFIMTS